jgi:hypothetical protein
MEWYCSFCCCRMLVKSMVWWLLLAGCTERFSVFMSAECREASDWCLGSRGWLRASFTKDGDSNIGEGCRLCLSMLGLLANVLFGYFVDCSLRSGLSFNFSISTFYEQVAAID